MFQHGPGLGNHNSSELVRLSKLDPSISNHILKSGTTSGSPEEDQKDHGMNTNTQPERMIPPKAIKFHSVTGVQIELLENGLYAKRKGPDFAHDNGVVYGSQPIPYRGQSDIGHFFIHFDTA